MDDFEVIDMWKEEDEVGYIIEWDLVTQSTFTISLTIYRFYMKTEMNKFHKLVPYSNPTKV